MSSYEGVKSPSRLIERDIEKHIEDSIDRHILNQPDPIRDDSHNLEQDVKFLSNFVNKHDKR